MTFLLNANMKLNLIKIIKNKFITDTLAQIPQMQ